MYIDSAAVFGPQPNNIYNPRPPSYLPPPDYLPSDSSPLIAAALAPLRAQFERLLALLTLTEQERAFVRGAPANPDLFSVLADYLADRGHPAESTFRKLASQHKN